MRNTGTGLALFFGMLAISTAQSPQLEVVWRKETLHPVAVRALYRFATCPSGLTLVTSTNGDFLAVASDGTVLADRREDELTDVTASTCDPDGRLLVLTEGWLKVFELDQHATLTLAAKHWLAGGPGRLLATPQGDLYVVGMAYENGQHVFLRRFRLSDGKYLGAPQVDIPFTSGVGFNSFAVNGSLAWNPVKQEAVFAAANPARLWRMTGDDTVHAVSPEALTFEDADVSPQEFGRGNWQSYDWIRNMAPLPDGGIVVQVFRGKDNPPPAGESFAYLAVLDGNYHTAAGKVALPTEPFLGLLSGADAQGNLYFVDLKVGSVAKLNKGRLTR